MELKLTLKDKDGNQKVIKRDETNLIEMERFLELRAEINEAVKNKEHTELKSFKQQVEFIAFIFKNQNVTEEDLMTGMSSSEFDDYFEDLCRQISPSHFKRADEIKERIQSRADKKESK